MLVLRPAPLKCHSKDFVMSTAPSALAQLNGTLARAFGTVTGAVGMIVGENAVLTAQCAEVTYLRACDAVGAAFKKR